MVLNIKNGLARGPIWFLVADQSQVRIFEQQKKNTEYFLVKKWKNPEAKMKAGEILSDRQGRSFDSFTKSRGGQGSSPRHAMSGIDLHQRSIDHCVSQIVKTLDKASTQKKFGKLILVAESRLLGRVEDGLKVSTAKKIHSSLEKDFAKLDDIQLVKRLEKLF